MMKMTTEYEMTFRRKPSFIGIGVFVTAVAVAVCIWSAFIGGFLLVSIEAVADWQKGLWGVFFLVLPIVILNGLFWHRVFANTTIKGLTVSQSELSIHFVLGRALTATFGNEMFQRVGKEENGEFFELVIEGRKVLIMSWQFEGKRNLSKVLLDRFHDVDEAF